MSERTGFYCYATYGYSLIDSRHCFDVPAGHIRQPTPQERAFYTGYTMGVNAEVDYGKQYTPEELVDIYNVLIEAGFEEV